MLLILKYILLLLIPKSNFVIRVILLYILSLFLLFIPILLLLLLWILFVYCYGIDAWSIKYLNQPILHLKCRESKASAMVMGYSIELIYFTTHMFVFKCPTTFLLSNRRIRYFAPSLQMCGESIEMAVLYKDGATSWLCSVFKLYCHFYRFTAHP